MNIETNILESIDNINTITIESELDVCKSLLNSYEKMSVIVENYHGDSIDGFEIFQEGFGDDIKNDMKRTGADKSTLMKVLTALPRFIMALFRAIKKKFSKTMDRAEDVGNSVAAGIKNASEEVKENVSAIFNKDESKRKKALKTVAAALVVGSGVGAVRGIMRHKKRIAAYEEAIGKAESLSEIKDNVREYCRRMNEGYGPEIKELLNKLNDNHTTNDEAMLYISVLTTYHEEIVKNINDSKENIKSDCYDLFEDRVQAAEAYMDLSNIITVELREIRSQTYPENLRKVFDERIEKTQAGDIRPVGGSSSDNWKEETDYQQTEISDIPARIEAEVEAMYRVDKDDKIKVEVIEGKLFATFYIPDDLRNMQINIDNIEKIINKTDRSSMVQGRGNRWGEPLEAQAYSNHTMRIDEGIKETRKAYGIIVEEVESKAYDAVRRASTYIYDNPDDKDGIALLNDNVKALKYILSTYEHDMEIFDHLVRALYYVDKYYIQKSN